MSGLDRTKYLGRGPDLSIKGRYATPAETPLINIQVYPGMISYEDMQPLIASNGAPIAATGQGTWGQLYAARRGWR